MTTTNPVNFYDEEARFAERYSSKKFWEKRYHNERLAVVRALLKHHILVKCQNFVDIGCGTGEYLSFSHHLIPEVYGVDISKEYLRRCMSCRPTGLVSADARFLPFDNLAFDCVLCSEVIEHVQDQENAIQEVFRVARKFVILSTPNQGVIRSFLSLVARPLVAQIDSRVGHVNILKFQELLRKLRNDQWEIRISFTMQAFPPSLDDVRLPSFTAPVIHALESASNHFLPTQGSISFVVLRRKTNEPH